jgi:16S rRNA (guanine527-N7)-methyltransferase
MPDVSDTPPASSPREPLWDQLAADLGLAPLADEVHAKLARYVDVLLRENAKLNLTRIRDPHEARSLHVADALSLLPHLPDPSANVKLADIGSGGGVPGLVLAIARPAWRVTLVESVAKKARFLAAAAKELGLDRVHVITARAEDAGFGSHRGSFDVVTSRAVAELAFLAEWCLPLLKAGGVMLAMKGPKAADELSAARVAIQRCGGSDAAILPVTTPVLPVGHVVVRVAKDRPTPADLPRPATVAKGRPLV